MYEKTKTLLEEYIEEEVFPGYSVAFLKGETVEKVIAGKMTPNSGVTLHDGMYYDLASVTKAVVTGTLLLQMIELGELDLDTALVEYFPEAKEKEVTLRHLVTHTSGLAGFIPNRDQLNADELVQALLQLPKTDTFYQTMKYTDTGLVLAGKVIEKVTGQQLADVFQERVLDILGITEMEYGPIFKHQSVPTEYLESESMYLSGRVHDPKASVLKRSCGSAGLFATIDGMIQYMEMLLHKGLGMNGARLLKEESVEKLVSDWTPSRCAGRSLVWDLQVVDGEAWLRHTGFTGTAVVWNLAHQEGFILLTNRIAQMTDTPLYNRYRDCLLYTYIKESQAQRKLS
ncbi:CubicO group peptidase, beta-lactamase class C family [Granulicatella balaenopterae]|uniref:CubicO group peptidase, beta-lactamase class C family n=1 Tax=Granulicatella balaenopterae TaxID=137733 RepID=A0A1H9JIH6_9LACT|nr:serine hydrolase domain-containing protein [Granulicatella balaenopterae]SEQ86620.1 CubicO group peptidase, beta-lactamase class C family [Granulicatella balaenopterae]